MINYWAMDDEGYWFTITLFGLYYAGYEFTVYNQRIRIMGFA